jgi:hypothetical protein
VANLVNMCNFVLKALEETLGLPPSEIRGTSDFGIPLGQFWEGFRELVYVQEYSSLCADSGRGDFVPVLYNPSGFPRDLDFP